MIFCDSEEIRFRKNYIQTFSLRQNQIYLISYDTIVHVKQVAYRQQSSMIPIYVLSVIGLVGAGYLITKVFNEFEHYHMPDP
jgi:hypothetical protein